MTQVEIGSKPEPGERGSKERGALVQKEPETCSVNRIQRNVPLWKEREASKSDLYGEFYKLWRK